jgi:CheY-like chemotaxis protein
MSQITFLFGDLGGERAQGVAAFASELPHLCRGTLAGCDLGIRPGGLLVCSARFRSQVPEAVRVRLSFWAWHCGGSRWTCPSAGDEDGITSPVAGCDPMLAGVGPSLLRCAVSSLLGRIEGAGGALGEARLVLSLALGTPEAAGLAFDRRRLALFVPSPHPLPLGDDVVLRLQLPDGEWMAAEGIVTAARAAAEDGPGSPAGFVLGLEMPEARVAEALDAQAGLHSTNRRRAPRYTVRARAAVSMTADVEPSGVARLSYATPVDFAEDYVENLSQSGAFVRTTEPLLPETRVHLRLELPGGAEVAAPGVVVHRNDRGVGVRFDLDARGEAAVAHALMQVTARRRRALVVDDDLLARRMLGDALAERGFEVFAAADGVDGLRTLTDLLLGLDLLVTDLRMPGLDGEQLLRIVRDAGGEQDLAIVVVSGNADAAAEQRLLAAGADAVLAKGEGTAALANAAEGAVLQRSSGAGRGSGADPARLPERIHALAGAA